MRTIVLLFLLAGCAHFAKQDSVTALEAGDMTALIEGCGHQLIPGYTYCRKSAGQLANDSIVFVTPPGTRAVIQVYFPNGDPTYAVEFEDRIEVPWKILLKRDTFEIQDRGFWLYHYTIYSPELPRPLITEGEIRLRVFNSAPGYVPLQNNEADPNYFWEWIAEQVKVKMTSGGRTFVETHPQVH